MESGERCRSLPAVPPPRVPSQRPAGGTIPLPVLFQAADLRLGRSPHLVPLAPRVQGLSPGPGGGGARAYDKVSTGLKGRGARSPPGEAQEPGAGLAGVGGRGGSRGARIASNLQPHLYPGRRRVSPAPARLHGARRRGRGSQASGRLGL